LTAGSDLVIQVHYPAGSENQSDSTQLNIFFTPNNSVRNVYNVPILNHSFTLVNGPLFIPANTVKTFLEEYTLSVFPPVSVLGVGPHMHLLGQNIHSFAVKPNGDTVKFIRINHWDFHWQGFYQFPKLLKLDGGSTMYAEATYDNTTNNVNNPNDPPLNVYLGESTTDEMMLVYFSFLIYQPGDENIVVDSSFTGIDEQPSVQGTMHLYDCSPNPAADFSTVRFYLPGNSNASVDLLDVLGNEVMKLSDDENFLSGMHEVEIPLNGLASGIYFVRVSAGSEMMTKKLMVNR